MTSVKYTRKLLKLNLLGSYKNKPRNSEFDEVSLSKDGREERNSDPEVGCRVGEPSTREQGSADELTSSELQLKSPKLKSSHATKHAKRGQSTQTGDFLILTDLSAASSRMPRAASGFTSDRIKTRCQKAKRTSFPGRKDRHCHTVGSISKVAVTHADRGHERVQTDWEAGRYKLCQVRYVNEQ
jgi:hypothetical protein